MSDAANKLAVMREELETLKLEAALKLRPTIKRGEKVIYLYRPQFLPY